MGSASAWTVVSLPPSRTNRGFAYARAEYRNSRGERRVLVWQVNVGSGGRTGSISLRDGLGADDLPGTRRSLARHELEAVVVRIEATGRIEVAGDVVSFPPELATEFAARCRARLADTASGGAG